MFRHLRSVGILRVEREMQRAFSDRFGEALTLGIYLPDQHAFYRMDPDKLPLDFHAEQSSRPSRAVPVGGMHARLRRLRYAAKVVGTFVLRRRGEDRSTRARRLARDLMGISDDDYAAVRRWFALVLSMRPGLMPFLERLDEINWQVSQRIFDFGDIMTFAPADRIDPASVTQFVSAGGFWSDDRHKLVYAARETHGWSVHYLIYDLIPIKWRHVTEPTTKKTFPLALHWVLWGVDQMFTISDTTRSDLIGYMEDHGYPLACRDHIHTTHLGSEVAAPVTDAGEISAVLRKFGLEPGRFVLIVGTLEPRKNHAFSYLLWKELHARYPGQIPSLIWVGQPGWQMDGLMRQVSEDYGLPHQAIRSLTNVTDTELGVLYGQCRFSLYPSFYEGWGLPVVEAMAQGRPCVASDAPAMVEASRGHAIHIGLHDGERWIETCHALITDETRYAEACAAAEAFDPVSWQTFRATVTDRFAAFQEANV